MAVQDKTEAATPKRREDARRKGSVAKSVDLTGALVFLVCLYTCKTAGPYMMQNLTEIVRDSLSHLATREITEATIWSMAANYGVRSLLICAPVMLAGAAIGFGVNVAQVGLRTSAEAMAPDLKRMNPISGIARLFSMKGLVELVKSLLKVGVVGYVLYVFMREELPHMNNLADMPLSSSVSVVAGLCWRMLVKSTAVVIIIAIMDYGYQKWQFETNLRMTKQEIKDEARLQEGDPQIKGRIRQKQRQIARQRMMRDVPKADVIITNPTHIAVAIKYDAMSMSAPTVLAKGQRLMAQKIKEVAIANGVPIVENKPVARALYQAVEIGEQIPEDLFQAVAEILAYVYRISQRGGARRASAA